MGSEKVLFDQQIMSVRNLSSIYQYLVNTATTMDSSLLLRSEYVLIVSAFDSYLHSIVRRKIRENFFTSQFLPSSLNLPITDYLSIHNESDMGIKQQLLDVALRKCLEKDSYQSPQAVEYALNLINIKSIWRTCTTTFGDTADNIRRRLALIIQRRNQIAHESDIDPTGAQRNITQQTVDDCREFFNQFVAIIDALIT